MLTSKCTCEDGVDGVDQVKMAIDQVKQVRKDLVIGWLRTSDDTRRHCGGSVIDT
jgi:hypothetical protein